MRRMKRSPRDKLTSHDLQKMPVETQVQLLNRRLGYYYQQDNSQKELRAIEKYLLKDTSFIWQIQKARNDLNISAPLDYQDYESDPSIVADWLICQIAGKNIVYGDDDYKEYDEKVTNITARLLENLVLPNGWFDYIQAYLALDTLPAHTEIDRDPLIMVEGIESDEVVIRMTRGLRSKDYVNAWKALKPFFMQPKMYLYGADGLKDRIYLDRKRGLGISEIARKYLPNQYKADAIASRDYVKKILKRYK